MPDAGLMPALLALMKPDERGDPESPLRWTTRSLRHLAEELTRQGHPVSAPTAGDWTHWPPTVSSSASKPRRLP